MYVCILVNASFGYAVESDVAPTPTDKEMNAFNAAKSKLINKETSTDHNEQAQMVSAVAVMMREL